MDRWAKWALEPETDPDLNPDSRGAHFMPEFILNSVKNKNDRKNKVKAQHEVAKSMTAIPSLPPIHFHLPGLSTPIRMSQFPSEFTSTAHAPTQAQSTVICSSPAASEEDPDGELEAYMDELIAKHPMKKEKLVSLKERLLEEDMTLKKVHEMKRLDLQEAFDISIGLAMEV